MNHTAATSLKKQVHVDVIPDKKNSFMNS